MSETVDQRIAAVEAKIDENHRLAALLGEVQRSLAAEAAHLAELRQRLVKEHKEPLERHPAALAESARLSRREPPSVDNRVLDFLATTGAEADQARVAAAQEPAAPKGRPTPADYAEARQQVAEGKRAARDAARSVLTAAREATAALAPPHEREPKVVEEAPAPADYAEARQRVAEGKRAARDAARSVLTAARGATAALAPPHKPGPKVVEEAPTPGEQGAQPSHASVAPPEAAVYEGRAAEPEATGADAELRAEEKHLLDTLDAGRQALANIDRCMDLLRGVARGGTGHAIASVVWSKSPDHVKIHEARQAAHEAQANLHRFGEQVAGLRHRLGEKVGIGGLAAMADRLLGHATGEAPDEPGLLASLESMREAYHDVRGLCSRLQREAIAVRARLAAMERDKRRMSPSA